MKILLRQRYDEQRLPELNKNFYVKDQDGVLAEYGAKNPRNDIIR
jgi:hypothetical protein